MATTTTSTLLSGTTQTVVFVAGTTAVERLNLDANATLSYDLSAAGQNLTTDGIDVAVAVVGDRVLVEQGGYTVALPATLTGPPARVGPSVGFLVSRQPGRVWLVSVPTTGPVVQEFDLAGHATSARSAIPVDWQPTAVVSTGLLLTSTLGFEVWDPAAGRVGYQSPSQATVVAAGGDQVAWQFSGCFNLCALHLTDLSTGVTSILYPQPPDTMGGLQSGSFSPDGRFLAASSYGPSGGNLTILDLQTQRTESIPAVDSGGPATPVWSPSGRWIFLVQGGGVGTLYAFERGYGSAQTARLAPSVSGTMSIAATGS